ncbi:MAG: helix-turn-helix domain-containing protein [Betaproteobacteria bacterium]
MPESFGARLRQRREEQSIALTTIAERTKIGASLLEALERDDVSHWPSGIFRRSFMRDYARAIGLEPDGVVREFLELHPDPLELAGTDPAVAPEPVPGDAAPPTRFRHAVSSLLRRGRRADGQRSAVDALPPAESAAVSVRVLSDPPLPAPPPVDLNEDPLPVAAPPGLQEPLTVAASVEAAAPVPAANLPAQAAEPDLLAAARLCTELGRVADAREAVPLIEESVRILDAVGLIVWVWNPQVTALIPALAHGYPDRMLAQLPRVGPDADNPTAAAFRAAETCVVDCSDHASGALVVPLITPVGCVGVLAIELRHGSEQRASVRALAIILAAQLARLIEPEQAIGTADRRLA